MVPPEIPGHTPCSVLIWVVLWLAATAILVKLGPQVVHHYLETFHLGSLVWLATASELRPEPRLMPAGRAQRSTGVAESAGGVPTVRLGAVA